MALNVNKFDVDWQQKQLELLDSEFCDILSEQPNGYQASNDSDYSDMSDLDVSSSINIEKILNKKRKFKFMRTSQESSLTVSISPSRHKQKSPISEESINETVNDKVVEAYERLFSQSPSKQKINLDFLSPNRVKPRKDIKAELLSSPPTTENVKVESMLASNTKPRREIKAQLLTANKVKKQPITNSVSSSIQNESPLTWQFVHYEINKTLQNTKNIAVGLQNDSQSKYDNAKSSMHQCNQLEWNFDQITNVSVRKWSKRIYALEQGKNVKTNPFKLDVVRVNKMYSKAKRDFVSRNRCKHLYGDAVLRNIRSNKQQKITENLKRKRSKNINHSHHILLDKLRESLSDLYDEISLFNTTQIEEKEFVHSLKAYIESHYHSNASYLQNDYLPKLWHILIAYDSKISQSTFIKHTEIVLNKRHFINAAKQYCSALKSNSFHTESISFNPDILRLAAVMLSKLNFSIRLLPKHQIKERKVIKAIKASRIKRADSKWNVFSRLHSLAMSQKQKLAKQHEAGKIIVDDECTFHPKISPYAQRKSRRNRIPSTFERSKSAKRIRPRSRAQNCYSELYLN